MCDQVAACVVSTTSESETFRFGSRIGSAAVSGDIICLNGELGAGKTTLVQGIASGLGIATRQVNSPTFSLLAEHLEGRLPLYHLDVYRLNSADQLYDLGFDDYYRQGDGLIVIEWASRIQPEKLGDRLVIDIELGETPHERAFHMSAFGPAGSRLASKIC